MTGKFTRASRKQSKIRLLLSGPSGSGKTYSALQIAFGLGKRVAVIDTERGSAELYSDSGEYYVQCLSSPFLTENYEKAIHDAETEGFDVIIIDSLTHAWEGEGGLLDQHDAVTGFGGNTWAAWKPITPKHTHLVEVILQSPAHIISTVRSKTAYAIDNSEGKNRPVKIGQAPRQKADIEYDYTIAFDLAQNHTVMVSKDRTGLFPSEYFTPTKETGEKIKAWLATGAEFLPQPPRATAAPAAPPTATVRSPPKVAPNGTKPAEDPEQFKGHLNDEMHCFTCGAKIDPSREGLVSKRDYGRYLCLKHLKTAKDEEAANAKPIAKPEPKPEEKRDQPSTSPLRSTIDEINARQEAIDKQTKKSLPGIKPDPHKGIVNTCQTCGERISQEQARSSLAAGKYALCPECLALMQDVEKQKPAVA